ncbi:MAG: hypothetical protein OEW58_01755 [Gammaproteobacteria bacterium]|nr:hypothetical protein [Gammaproteobacteria bacterium]
MAKKFNLKLVPKGIPQYHLKSQVIHRKNNKLQLSRNTLGLYYIATESARLSKHRRKNIFSLVKKVKKTPQNP